VVLGLVAFLLVPAPATASARHRLGGLAFGSGTTRSAPGAFDGDQLDLNQRGSLPLDPIATVPEDSPALWRSTAYDVYDGASWRRSPDRRQILTAGPAYPIAVAAGPVRTDLVTLARLSSADGGTLWSPGPIVSVTGPSGLTPVVDDSGGVVLQGVYAAYTVTSQQPETNPARLTSRSGADDPSPRWRSLPTAVPARVGLLARTITAGTITRYDAALAISSYLRSHATYRLDSPVPGPGEDAVDRFLFVDRTGFCEQFASAEVVLLRSLGIPARLVTGLAYGVPAGAGRLFRVADRHAWVEVLVPGVGWVSDDPTAGVPLATNRTAVGLRQRLANSLASALRALTQLPGGRPVLALALVVLALLGGLVVGRRPRRQPLPSTGGPRPRAAPGPALSAFLRFDQRLGPTRRRQHESLRDLAFRLDPALTPALAVVEQECYGPGAPSAGQVQSAVALLDGG
jgi:transglutaminase-like putative cysteine protease